MLLSLSLFQRFFIHLTCTYHMGNLLALSLLMVRWAGDNTDLHSNSNISKTVRVNVTFAEAATGAVLKEKLFLEILKNSQENTCARISFFNKVAGLRPANFIKKETLSQLFSCEFCEISKNTFFKEPLWATSFSFTEGFLIFL